MSTRKPLVGIPADRRPVGPHYFHCVGKKHHAAVMEGAQAVSTLIPPLGEGLEARELPWKVKDNPFSGPPLAVFREAARSRADERSAEHCV